MRRAEWFQHTPLSEAEIDAPPWKGHWMGFFRDPYSRTTSNYRHYLEDQESLPGLLDGSSPLGALTEVCSEDGYRRRSTGLVTMMLAGQQDGGCAWIAGGAECDGYNFAGLAGMDCDVTRTPDLPKALARLDSFKFVGLQEEWAQSICLFHMKLGGECFEVEVENARPSTYDRDLTTSNYTDPIDTALYEEVRRRYYADVAAYNVTDANCRRRCPALADFYR